MKLRLLTNVSHDALEREVSRLVPQLKSAVHTAFTSPSLSHKESALTATQRAELCDLTAAIAARVCLSLANAFKLDPRQIPIDAAALAGALAQLDLHQLHQPEESPDASSSALHSALLPLPASAAEALVPVVLALFSSRSGAPVPAELQRLSSSKLADLVERAAKVVANEQTLLVRRQSVRHRLDQLGRALDACAPRLARRLSTQDEAALAAAERAVDEHLRAAAEAVGRAAALTAQYALSTEEKAEREPERKEKASEYGAAAAKAPTVTLDLVPSATASMSDSTTSSPASAPAPTIASSPIISLAERRPSMNDSPKAIVTDDDEEHEDEDEHRSANTDFGLSQSSDLEAEAMESPSPTIEPAPAPKHLPPSTPSKSLSTALVTESAAASAESAADARMAQLVEATEKATRDLEIRMEVLCERVRDVDSAQLRAAPCEGDRRLERLENHAVGYSEGLMRELLRLDGAAVVPGSAAAMRRKQQVMRVQRVMDECDRILAGIRAMRSELAPLVEKERAAQERLEKEAEAAKAAKAALEAKEAAKKDTEEEEEEVQQQRLTQQPPERPGRRARKEPKLSRPSTQPSMTYPQPLPQPTGKELERPRTQRKAAPMLAAAERPESSSSSESDTERDAPESKMRRQAGAGVVSLPQVAKTAHIWPRLRWTPRFEAKEAGPRYMVRASLPGMEQKDVQVSLQESGRLVVSGTRVPSAQEESKLVADAFALASRGAVRIRSRDDLEQVLLELGAGRYGTFRQEFEVPNDVDVDKITARLQDGEFVLTLPKRAARPSSRAQAEFERPAVYGGWPAYAGAAATPSPRRPGVPVSVQDMFGGLGGFGGGRYGGFDGGEWW